ncbi:TetR/AcrR family transcriptional regulator [Microbacterium elymi]|uniref:TetR/AcrR family transcriptional regulator n=1 Tax=Microbacterium elymi TaxID=2909587 RepID=A0ABY5NLA1_9MICO|nr:TetR/AcrR family transcriptional regulator [Microbacterium elymi]UUT35959.1 TetR/AcrR family transcriptional regulator [Microbacterium elymi]
MANHTTANHRGRAQTRLDREAIVAAGLELAASSGRATVSVRELGARLGADPTAIYRHFSSKEEVMRALLDAVIAESVAAVQAEPADWEQRLRELATHTLRTFIRYPAIGAEATTLTTHGPGELSAIELMLDAFTRAGLNDQDVVRHYALLAQHSLSGAAGIARAQAGGRARHRARERRQSLVRCAASP